MNAIYFISRSVSVAVDVIVISPAFASTVRYPAGVVNGNKFTGVSTVIFPSTIVHGPAHVIV